MFAYCTEILHLSEAEAYLRIAAARASREHPLLLTMLADGRLHLTAIAKLAPHLTPGNKEALLARAACKSKREIEELVAELAPRPDAPAAMRKLPERRLVTPAPSRPGGLNGAEPSLGLHLDRVAGADFGLRPDGVAGLPASARPRPAAVEPLAPARYKVQFTVSAELRDKLERLQALMRSSVPDGDPTTAAPPWLRIAARGGVCSSRRDSRNDSDSACLPGENEQIRDLTPSGGGG